MLKAGDKAPDFTGTDDRGHTVALKDFRGRKVVLYFYPKDNTSGCTREACDFRDSMAGLSQKGVVVLVLGVSPDSVSSHQKFKTKFSLPFALLSDGSHAIAEAYGAWQSAFAWRLGFCEVHVREEVHGYRSLHLRDRRRRPHRRGPRQGQGEGPRGGVAEILVKGTTAGIGAAPWEARRPPPTASAFAWRLGFCDSPSRGE